MLGIDKQYVIVIIWMFELISPQNFSVIMKLLKTTTTSKSDQNKVVFLRAAALVINLASLHKSKI